MFEEFSLPFNTLQRIAQKFREAMLTGLTTYDSSNSLPMLPTFTYISKLPPKNGTYLGVDFGGTNFRMALVEIYNCTHTYLETPLSLPIPSEFKTGSGHRLFEFIAKTIKNYTLTFLSNSPSAKIYMGFTFSYPTRQTSPNSGYILEWAKDIDCPDVIGCDVVTLLQQQLDCIMCPVTIVALLNDTVAPIMAYKCLVPTISVGSIFGTGTNGAYIESTDCILKDPALLPNRQMLINTEWGSFWCPDIPVTKYDLIVDKKSLYPGKQQFEKLISGRYLNEIIYEFVNANAALFAEEDRVLLNMKLVTEITDELNAERRTERRDSLIRKLCISIIERAAKFGAIAIACCLERAAKLDENACVAVDGSLYEKNALFKKTLQATVCELVGRDVTFHKGTIEECSCLGAVYAISPECFE